MARYYKQTIKAGFIIPAHHGRTTNQYLQEFTRLNRHLLETQYRHEEARFATLGEDAIEAFHKQNPSIEAYVRKQFPKTGYVSKQRLLTEVTERFASYTEAHKEHIKDLIEDSGLYEDLLLKINEELNPDRISYLGDNIYQYTTNKGVVVKFRFRDYSPTILEFIED